MKYFLKNKKEYDFISISHYFYPRIGGLENMAFNLISGLQKKGLKCIAVYGSEKRKSSTLNDFQIESFPVLNIFNGTYPIFGLRFILYVLRLLQANPNAQVLIHSRHLMSSLITFGLCILTGHQYTVVEHNAGPVYFKSPFVNKLAQWMDKNIFSLVHKYASNVIAVSNTGRNWISKTFGTDKKLIDVIYNGFDGKEIKNSISKKENIVVWAAKWIEVKDPTTALKGYKKIAKKYPDWKFVLIGEGNSLKKLKNLPSNVEVLPELIKQEDLFRLLKKSKVYVNSSLSEGLALGILEASAFGNIPVISNAPSNKEVARKIDTLKYIFKRGNSSDLASKIELAIANSSERNLVKKIIKSTSTIFASKNMIENYYAYLYPEHFKADHFSKISLVIPAFNEERSILSILEKVVEVKFPRNIKKEIVIVNDCSTDETRTLLESYIRKNKRYAEFKLLDNPTNLGKSQTIKHGILHTTGDLVVIQDADLEYNPNDLIAFVNTFLEYPNVDVIYGNRFNRKNIFISPTHYLGNKFVTFLSNLLTFGRGFTTKDMETCYKMAKGDLFRKLISTLESTTNFGLEPEITAKFSLYRRIDGKRLNFKQLDVHYKPRTQNDGKKMRWFKHGVEALKEIVYFNIRNKRKEEYNSIDLSLLKD
jgi:glycosyltransferase involved in cell wall biosynthesis